MRLSLESGVFGQRTPQSPPNLGFPIHCIGHLLDVFAYANSEQNTAFVVEVKSHLRLEGIDQLRQILARFRQFLPEHADKKLYGILAVVDAPEDLRQETLASGLYLAGIHEDQFLLQVPPDFQPRVW